MISLSHFSVAVAADSGQAAVTDRLVYCPFLLVGWVSNLPVIHEIGSAFGLTCVCLQMQVVSCKTLSVSPYYFRSVSC